MFVFYYKLIRGALVAWNDVLKWGVYILLQYLQTDMIDTIFCVEFFIQLSVTLFAKTWWGWSFSSTYWETVFDFQWNLKVVLFKIRNIAEMMTESQKCIFLPGLKCYWKEACNYHLRPYFFIAWMIRLLIHISSK